MVGVLYCSISKNKIRLRFPSIGNVEGRYCWGGFSIENTEINRAAKNKVQLLTNIVENTKIRYG